jgi:subtilisin-like proprotein convertase family protein
MVKAMLLNTARYLDGVDSGDTLPSYNQGHGEVNVAAALSDTARIVVDQSKILRTTGETFIVYGYVSRPGDPVRVTLAWTDAPGSTVGDAYVNDLDLTVAVSGTTYRGNVFDGAYAATGGLHDRMNNVESVFTAPGVRGPLTITVDAYNLAGDGVPGDTDPTDQDFALVCTNCQVSPAFDLTVHPPQLERCISQTAAYTIIPEARDGFSGSIALQVTGHPAGSSTALDPNPVPVSASSHLTITTPADTRPGAYAMRILGTSASMTASVTAALDLYGAPPVTSSLQTPPDGVLVSNRHLSFSWSPVKRARGYRIEIASDAAFDAPIYSATVESSHHTLPISLAYEARYDWRVIPLNPCGEGPPSPAWQFTTGTAPLHVCLNVGQPISDMETLTTTLVISEALPVLDLDVALTATHSWVGDLEITLRHQETGADVVLFDRPGVPETDVGCGGADLDIVLDDEADISVEDSCASVQPAYGPGDAFQPNSPLRVVDGYGLNGHWTLKVTDWYTGDEGALDRWCLISTLMPSGDAPGAAFGRADYRTSRLTGTMPISVTLSRPGAQTVTVRYATGIRVLSPGYTISRPQVPSPLHPASHRVPLRCRCGLRRSARSPARSHSGYPRRAMPY